MRKLKKGGVTWSIVDGSNLPAFQTGGISTDGYKRNSEDVNNDYNLIRGNSHGTPITMVGVDFPVKGTDNLGNTQMMYPGGEYQFPGSIVTEHRAQKGGSLPKAQKGISPAVLDSIRHQAKRTLLYEKGDPNNPNTGGGYDQNTEEAYPMPDWGYHESQSVPADPNFIRPTSLGQATNRYMQEVAPRVSENFPKALTNAQAGDFLFSTGRKIEPYIIDQMYKEIYNKPEGIPNRRQYNVDTKKPAFTPELSAKIDSAWKANKPEWDKLSYDKQQALMGLARESYGQAIFRGQGEINENLAPYKKVWHGRIPNLNSANYDAPIHWDQNQRRTGGSLPKAQTGIKKKSLIFTESPPADTLYHRKYDNISIKDYPKEYLNAIKNKRSAEDLKYKLFDLRMGMADHLGRFSISSDHEIRDVLDSDANTETKILKLNDLLDIGENGQSGQISSSELRTALILHDKYKKQQTLVENSENKIHDKANDYWTKVNYVTGKTLDYHNHDTFIIEAEKLKRYYERREPGTQVDIEPVYGAGDTTRIKQKLQGLNKGDDLVNMWHHSRDRMAGLKLDWWADKMKPVSDKGVTCYSGSCSNKDLVEPRNDDNDYNDEYKPPFAGLNYVYRPNTPWIGVNEYGKDLIHAMYSNQYTGNTSDLDETVKPVKGKQYDIHKAVETPSIAYDPNVKPGSKQPLFNKKQGGIIWSIITE